MCSLPARVCVRTNKGGWDSALSHTCCFKKHMTSWGDATPRKLPWSISLAKGVGTSSG